MSSICPILTSDLEQAMDMLNNHQYETIPMPQSILLNVDMNSMAMIDTFRFEGHRPHRNNGHGCNQLAPWLYLKIQPQLIRVPLIRNSYIIL